MSPKKAMQNEKDASPAPRAMRIALVAPYADPEKGACTLRVRSLQEFLQARGHHVEVFAPARHSVATSKGIHRYASIKELMQKIMEKKFDAVWGTSPPMTHSFFAGIAAKLSGAKFVTDVRDPWSYVVNHSESYARQPFKRWIFSIIDTSSYLLSDQIWVVTAGIKNIITRSLPVSKKTHIIPNGTTPALFYFDMTKRAAIRKRLGIRPNEVLAIYMGGFVEWEADRMLAAAAPILEKNDIKIIFIIPFGKTDENGMQESHDLMELRAIAQRSKAEKNVIFIDEKEVPFESLSSYLSAADVGLATVPDELPYCFRVKAYDYVSAGLPVMAKAPADGTMHQIIERTQIGACASTWNGFVSNLEKFSESSAFSKKERARLAQLAIYEFDRNISNRHAEELLQKLVQK